MKDMTEIKKLIAQINCYKEEINIMEVCGTHTMSISKFGLRSILNENINLISGPGCPVCVTPDIYLDYIYDLSLYKDIIIATYGDMMTLLLVFFVLLFSMSTVDTQKYKAVVQSLSGSLGMLDSGTTVTMEPLINNFPSDSPTDSPSEYEEFNEMQDELQKILEENNLKGNVKLELGERGLIVRFLDNVLFDSGKADLTPKAKLIIDSISGVLQQSNKRIAIEGHTDNVPISTYKYPSNWELSTTRAVNVVKYMIDNNHIDPIRLSAAGYADQHPISNNSTPEGRESNRRVDMVILRSESNQSGSNQ
jgi:chemotaxis protein MotB